MWATTAIAQSTKPKNTTDRTLEIKNKEIHLKQDLIRGGAICYISKADSDRNIVNIYDGLKEKWKERKIKIYTNPSEYYREIIPQLLENTSTAGLLLADPFVEEPFMPTDIIKDAAKNADTAICVIGRNSGEERDRTNTKGDF